MSEASAPYRVRDPQKIRDRSDEKRQFRRAREISKLPENLWTQKVDLELPDDQEQIWKFLRARKLLQRLRRR